MDSLGGTREAPGRQKRTNWTAWEAPGRRQGGRKGLIGQPGRHQGGTGEAGKEYLDSLRGTREALGRLERTIWTAWEAPGRHQGLLKAILRYESYVAV